MAKRMTTASSRTLVGSVLAHRWRLTQKLGEGGMGEVYAAEQVGGGARVAVKVLRSEFLADPVVLSRFAEEGRACMRLVHPNIVRVLECAAVQDGSPYIVMDLLEGVPLGAYTQNGGRVPIAQAVAILQGMLAGLAAAHAQGVIHRDLKPDNVFLMRHSGDKFVVKVLDFGIAKVMDAAGRMGSRTRAGMLLGTPAFMSPEQVRNASDVDQRADLWSAGVIFYEMLTGRVAFPAPTEYARLAAVVSSEPEPMDRIDPTLAGLTPFVMRALQKNRDHRYASALDMAHALAAASPSEAAHADGTVGLIAPLGTGPYSRLPPAPSVLARSEGNSEAGTSALAHTTPAPTVEAGRVGRQSPGGTLASSAETSTVVEPAPFGTMAPIGGTLPSKDLPLIVSGRLQAPSGVRPAVVAVLVAITLVVGFLLGWAGSQMR
jgi:eukaryotic-like serine/threonine-protein kinase